MSWDQIVEAIKQFWSQPVPIIGFTVGTVIIAVISIIAKTSIGKKQLHKLENEIKTGNAYYEEKIKTLTAYYEEQLQKAEQNKLLERQMIFDICNNINNVNIKALAEEYKAKFENINFDEIVKEAQESAVEEYKSQIEETFNQYKAETEELIKQLKEELAKLESEQNGESEQEN